MNRSDAMTEHNPTWQEYRAVCDEVARFAQDLRQKGFDRASIVEALAGMAVATVVEDCGQDAAASWLRMMADKLEDDSAPTAPPTSPGAALN